MHELFSNNSPFVGQLYEDKSLALHARDLIFFKLLHNNLLLERIYSLTFTFVHRAMKLLVRSTTLGLYLTIFLEANRVYPDQTILLRAADLGLLCFHK